MEWLGVLEKISSYLEEPEQAQLAEYYLAYKEKTAEAEKAIRKALEMSDRELSDEELYFTLRRIDAKSEMVFIQLTAMEGQLELAKKLEYYYDCDPRERIFYTSHAQYEKYKRENSAEYWANTTTSSPWNLGYRMLLFFHEVQAFIDQGVQLCCDNPKTRQPPFTVGKSHLHARQAFMAAYIFVSVGLFERARHYLELLHHYLSKLQKPHKNSDRAQSWYFRAMTECLEELILAHEAGDGEQARRHAARAILAQWRAVLENWQTEVTWTDDFKCYDIILSICIAVQFDFDPPWARECCRALLREIHLSGYHPAFFKAVEWDAWVRMPEEKGWMPTDQLHLMRYRTKKLKPS